MEENLRPRPSFGLTLCANCAKLTLMPAKVRLADLSDEQRSEILRKHPGFLSEIAKELECWPSTVWRTYWAHTQHPARAVRNAIEARLPEAMRAAFGEAKP